MAEMVQFLVTVGKRITRKGRLIPVGETIEISEAFVPMYYPYGKVVEPASAPVAAPEPAASVSVGKPGTPEKKAKPVERTPEVQAPAAPEPVSYLSMVDEHK